MLNGNVPEKVKSDCNFPNEKIRELGQKLKVSGTPTIFFTDNTRVAGAIDVYKRQRQNVFVLPDQFSIAIYFRIPVF